MRGFERPRARRDVDQRQHGEDIGLDDADEEAEGLQDGREDERSHREEDGDEHPAAHEVAEEADGEGEGAGHSADKQMTKCPKCGVENELVLDADGKPTEITCWKCGHKWAPTL